MKRIKLIHIFPDEKFFDDASNFFDDIDVLENHYIFYTNLGEDYQFRYIKNVHKLKIISSKREYYDLLSDPRYDGIFFHSLHPRNYKLFKHIGKDKTIFWWMWGYDVYFKFRLLRPLIGVDLYKSRTKRIIRQYHTENCVKRFLRTSYWLLRLPGDYVLQNKVLSRINYFIPVIATEYGLMSKNKAFRAKLFYPSGPANKKVSKEDIIIKQGNILIGNSLTYTNNHMDIFPIISNIDLKGRKFIIPINYGDGYCRDIQKFKDESGLKEENTIWLLDLMPYEKYSELMLTVSHAIMGHMRQQAMGNIYSCLQKGIKVFLYKDSMAYQFLKQEGFTVYTIDEDLNENELKSTMSIEDANRNRMLLEFKRDTKNEYRNKFIEIFSES